MAEDPEDLLVAELLKAIEELTPLQVAVEIEQLDDDFQARELDYMRRRAKLVALQQVVEANHHEPDDRPAAETPPPASGDDLLFDQVAETLAEHGKLRAKQIAELLGREVSDVNYVLNHNEGFLSPGAGWWMIDA